MNDRSDRLFEIGREAGEKYDYFMAGLSAALTAYLGQGFSPTSLSPWSSEILEACAILALVASFASAIKRISLLNQLLGVGRNQIENTERIELLEKALSGAGSTVRIVGKGTFSPAQAADMLKNLQQIDQGSLLLQRKFSRHAVLASRLRDGLMLAGFLVLVGARLLRAYS